MSEPAGLPARLPTAGATRDVVSMSRVDFEEGLEKARELGARSARKETRASAEREKAAALEAQAAENANTLAAALAAHEKAVGPRIHRAALGVGLLVALASAGVVAPITWGIARLSMTAGVDVGIEASARARVIDDVVTRGLEADAPATLAGDTHNPLTGRRLNPPADAPQGSQP